MTEAAATADISPKETSVLSLQPEPLTHPQLVRPHSIRAATFLAAILGSFVGLVAAAVPPANATFPGQNQHSLIAYGGTPPLRLVNPDGSRFLRWRMSEPALSKDGSKVASSSGSKIWVGEVDRPWINRRIDVVSAAHPAWTPTGRIVFQRGFPGSIWVMNADGSGLLRLSRFGFRPAVSPDGRKIAFDAGDFSTAQRGSQALWIMNSDGSAATRILSSFPGPRGPRGPFDPSFSPDGRRIVFSGAGGDRHSRDADLYTVGVDGSGLTRITRTTGDGGDSDRTAERDPVFSPDGRKIAFTRPGSGNQYSQGSLFYTSADGSGELLLANYGNAPDWGPKPARCGGKEATLATAKASQDIPTAPSNVIRGTPGPDVIVGTDGPDRIRGGGGRDIICAGGGNDRVLGGGGRDRINGGTGRDRLYGGSGGDRIRGATGNDRLRGQGGNDRLFGDAGNDRLSGGKGRDRIRGGKGRDRMNGGSGRDACVGGPNRDVSSSCNLI